MKKNNAVNNLKSLVIILVVLHHSILAYNYITQYSDAVMVGGVIPIGNMLNPIVDSSKSVIWNIINGINDTFFMPLMFFLSGLFVWSSLKRRGSLNYVLNRFKRLGVPLIVGVLFLIPLAYYPAAHQYALVNGIQVIKPLKFWFGMASIGFISGPFWFISVLFVFDLLATLIYRIFGARLEKQDNVNVPIIFRNSFVFISFMILISLIVYRPMMLFTDHTTWIGSGFFTIQIARLFHYMLYFSIGVWMGYIGIERTVFADITGKGIKWHVYLSIAITVFFTFAFIPFLNKFLLSSMSALLTASLLGLFFRGASDRGLLPWLSRYSFGIYVIHYTVSSWLQLWLLSFNISAIIKGVFAFLGTLIISILIVYVSNLVKEMLARKFKEEITEGKLKQI